MRVLALIALLAVAAAQRDAAAPAPASRRALAPAPARSAAKPVATKVRI